MKLKTSSCCLAAIFGLALAGNASAAGFQLLEQNASGLGNAYAGSAAVAEDASTIFFNPAGMTQLQSREVSIGGTLVRPSFSFSNNGSSSGNLTGSGGDAGGWNMVPNAYGSIALTDRLYFGLGVSAPFGLKTEYPNPWIGGAQSLVFDVKTYNINPSMALKLDTSLSIGAGVSVQKIEALYERVAGVGGAGGLAVYSNSLAKLEADDVSLGWNVGALLTPTPDTRIGLSYRSKVKHEIKGKITVTGPSAALNSGSSSDVKAQIDLPDMLILSMAQKLNDRWEVLGDVTWIGWSSLPKVDIIRTSGASNGLIAQTLDTEFRDTWRFALGANYKLNNVWKLRAGIAWDQTPVKSPATRLVSMPDNDRIWLSLGAQWKPAKDARLDFGAAYLFIRKSEIDNNQGTAANNRGRVTGNYTGNVFILGTQYSQGF